MIMYGRVGYAYRIPDHFLRVHGHVTERGHELPSDVSHRKQVLGGPHTYNPCLARRRERVLD